MKFRDIFFKNTRKAILLRGIIAIGVGILLATTMTLITGDNWFKRHGFPIFVVPVLLTLINLSSWQEDKPK